MRSGAPSKHRALVAAGLESGEKHGSRIRSPAVQRQASVRIVDSAVPKQEPLARSVMVMPVAGVPPGDQGLRVTTWVCASADEAAAVVVCDSLVAG
jgi:hypothetical protein